jgi:hypothetical protein
VDRKDDEIGRAREAIAKRACPEAKSLRLEENPENKQGEKGEGDRANREVRGSKNL